VGRRGERRARRHWGVADKPVRYIIVVVPPKVMPSN
jgi:hypothetical protein